MLDTVTFTPAALQAVWLFLVPAQSGVWSTPITFTGQYWQPTTSAGGCLAMNYSSALVRVY